MLTEAGMGQGPVRPWMLRTVTLLLAALWGYLFFGVTDLISFAAGPEFHLTLVLSTGWGALFVFLVGGPLLCVAIRPKSAVPVAVAQVGAVGAAIVIAAVLASYPRVLLVAAGLAVSVLVVVAAVGSIDTALPREWRWAVVPGFLVAAAVLPAAGYAWVSARATGSGQITDISAGVDHWPIQAAFPLSVLLIAGFAAGHPPGWRIAAWSVVVAVIWFAVVCWLEPHLTGSIGKAWSAITLGWALAFIAAMHLTPSAARPGRPHLSAVAGARPPQ